MTLSAENTLIQIIEIPLEDRISGDASIKFLRAELPAEDWSPFALIRYSLRGEEQEYGLRLDMDKRVFLDHFEDKGQEKVLKRAAPEIAEFIGDALEELESKGVGLSR